jgi:Hemerythrin HHE cation binding domain
MSEMSMNRAIHGAFRRDLDRFIAALSTFTPGDLTRARQLGTAWANFDDQLTHHHEGEHAIAWPALQAVGVSKEVLATMDAEHESMAASLAKTRTAIGALTQTAGAQESTATLAAFQALKSVTVAHLDHEEAEIEDVYLANRNTAELKAMGKAFGKVSPARGGRFFAWLLDGASPAEREAVTRDVPGPVISIMGGIFGRDYRRNVAPVWKAS